MFELVIRGGYIVDGTGRPGFVGDVAVQDGRVAAVEPGPGSLRGHREVDASGLVVSPGFIDIHTHADRAIIERPRAVNYVTQGVTTVVGGNCGGSMGPTWEGARSSHETIGCFLDEAEAAGLGINFATFVGQGNLRAAVMGTQERPPNEEEMRQMKSHLCQAIEEGAVGVTSGRRYMPGSLASDEEVFELLQALSPYGLLYSSHIKNQDVDMIPSVEELFRAGDENGVPVQLTHLKVCGKDNWGLSYRVNAMMEEARRRGIDVMSDVYPYTFTAMSSLLNRLPEEFRDRDPEQLLNLLNDDDGRGSVLEELTALIEENPVRARSAGQSGVVLAAHTGDFEGESLSEVAEHMGVDLARATVDLLRMNDLEVAVAGIMDEEDVRIFLGHDYAMVGSDGVVAGDDAGRIGMHPRNFGTFVRVLGRYCRDCRLFSLEKAVQKMTTMPSERLGLRERGALKEGWFADIVVFDEGEVGDNSTAADPAAPASGIRLVYVNGQRVVSDGRAECTGTPGRVLRYRGGHVS